MKHVWALISKFILVAIILSLILSSMTDLSLTEILSISLAVTVLAYIVGDLIILPISNNTIATIADAVLSLVVIYSYNYIYTDRVISFNTAVTAAVVLGVGEWFFHKYMANKVLPNRRDV
ncbi:MAG: DUF2512 family protein [Clostridiaceae bacterium]